MSRKYKKRTYRNAVLIDPARHFQVKVKETDLYVYGPEKLMPIAMEGVLRYRGYIESYIRSYPAFQTTLKPWKISGIEPDIIRDMSKASILAGVGPMAGVAGAVAEYTARDLLAYTDEIIVENGGDVFIRMAKPVTLAVFAGKSPLSMRLGIRVIPEEAGISVCTSSGTFGHSLSLGKADAVTVVAASCCLADAAATAIGNRVRGRSDIERAIDFGKAIPGISGLVVVYGKHIGAWGNLQIVPLDGKKG